MYPTRGTFPAGCTSATSKEPERRRTSATVLTRITDISGLRTREQLAWQISPSVDLATLLTTPTAIARLRLDPYPCAENAGPQAAASLP
jgi:hypothetical protein